MPREHTVARTGNHLKMLLDGIEIGLMQNLRASDDYGLEPVSGIGNIKVVEYVPTMARHNLSISFVCVRRDLLIEKGFIAENGDGALKGLVFDIEIYDKRDNQLVKKYIGCTFGSGDISFDAHRIIVRNATFMALDTSGKI